VQKGGVMSREYENWDLGEIFGGFCEKIGVYGGKNALWTLLNRRKVDKNSIILCSILRACHPLRLTLFNHRPAKKYQLYWRLDIVLIYCCNIWAS